MSEKTILRAQFDGRKGAWKIVKNTFNGAGGWAKLFKYQTFKTKDDAELEIDNLVESNINYGKEL